jgi:hypothetical protein
VLARSGELGLSPEQVKQLEERDGALQREYAELRERLEQPTPAAPGRPRGEGGLQPATGGRGGLHGGSGPKAERDEPGGKRGAGPLARAEELRRRLSDADTAAWLGAEEVLTEGQREPAREVAAKYRERLADEQEARGKARP